MAFAFFASWRISDLNYRLFRADDFEPLYAIERLCFEPPHRFSRGYMRQLVLARDGATWVAEDDGKIAGFAIVEWSRERAGMIAYLQTIEVAPEARGQGVGRELLRRAEDSARAAGAATVWLHVNAANAGAIRLYHAHGYACEGREEDYYGRGQPGLIYRKAFEAD
jgi:ribosomal-protein-alanine N-acetyltransferase